jgi:hypothetical protein
MSRLKSEGFLSVKTSFHVFSMLRKFIFFLLFMMAWPMLSCIAQNRDNVKKMLVGSWGRIDTMSNLGYSINNMYAEKPAERILTFYENGRFQEEITNRKFKSWRYLSTPTRWKILNEKEGLIKLFHSKSYAYMDWYFPETSPSNGLCKIIRISQDTLILRVVVSTKDSTNKHTGHSRTVPVFSIFTFKRIDLRKARHQNEVRPYDVVVNNTIDSTSIKRIAHGFNEITLQLKNDTIVNCLHLITGSLECINGDTLGISVYSETMSYTDINGKDVFFEKGVKGRAFYMSDMPLRLFPAKTIISITPLELRHPFMVLAGDAVVTLAAATTLLASPISASAPHFNSFDVHQFLAISGISILTGVVVGVPLIAIGHGPATEYYLDQESATKNNAPCWRIKPFVYE